MENKIELPPMPANGCEFLFKGGPRDGQFESCEKYGARAPGMTEAESYWFLTRDGKVGSCFGGISPGYMQALQNDAVFNEDGTIGGIGLAQSHLFFMKLSALKKRTAWHV